MPALAAGLLVGTAAGASAAPSTVTVTQAGDSGPGTFRDAVAEASADPSVRRIRFAPGLNVELTSAVEFTGDQDLSIDGRGSTISGATATPSATFDDGLLVSSGATRKLEIKNTHFADSFGNGIAVFVPAESNGVAQLTIVNSSISGSQFHGLYWDGQAYDGYNTDDEPHPACSDPYFVDSNTTLALTMRNVEVTANGDLDPAFDTSLATGCPQDFDGVRVDQGGEGHILADIAASHFDENLADGLELDEVDGGGVFANSRNSGYERNGDSGSPSDDPELSDKDDGLDIDEAGDGPLVATVVGNTISENFDEGLDLDEAGEGDARVTVINTDADRNEDQGLKTDEEDGGDLVFVVIGSSASGSLSQYGIETVEADDGNSAVYVLASTVTGNDDAGLLSEQGDAGSGLLFIAGSDLSGNPDGPYEVDGVANVKVVGTII